MNTGLHGVLKTVPTNPPTVPLTDAISIVAIKDRSWTHEMRLLTSSADFVYPEVKGSLVELRP